MHYFGKTGSTSTTLYTVVPIVTSDIPIGRKYVNGGNSTSFSPGYTLKKLMPAPCDMKLLDTNLKSNGDLLNAMSFRVDVLDVHTILESPVRIHSSIICRYSMSHQNIKLEIR